MASPAAATAPTPPAKDEWETMLGATLIQDSKGTKKIKTADALKGKEFVLLYFSAQWCPPCQAFSPILTQFYKAVQSKVEIIYISSDNSVTQFEEYFGRMPWLSLPVANTADLKNNLAKSMQVTGIPALICMKRDGSLFVTDQARDHVTTAMRPAPITDPAATTAAAEQVLKQWREKTPVPLSEAKFERLGAAPTGIWGLISQILKNPAAIFALFYFAKWAMRKYQTLMAGGEESGDAAGQEDNIGGEEIPQMGTDHEEF